MKNVSTGTWIRTVVMVVALINQVLTSLGWNPMPFSDEEVYSGLSMIISVATTLIAWWKNNSFSKEAVEADKYMDELKSEES